MLDSDDSALWYALNRLITNYWADVDENGGSEAPAFYLPDSVYAIGNNRFEGQDKIRAFYDRRRHSQILTRHLINNVRVCRDSERRARITGMMSHYRADGKSPFQGARPPAMIADFEAHCVCGDDGRWRIRSHELRPFIVGTDLPASIAIRPQAL